MRGRRLRWRSHQACPHAGAQHLPQGRPFVRHYRWSGWASRFRSVPVRLRWTALLIPQPPARQTLSAPQRRACLPNRPTRLAHRDGHKSTRCWWCCHCLGPASRTTRASCWGACRARCSSVVTGSPRWCGTRFKRVGSATYQATRRAPFACCRGRTYRRGRSRCRARSARRAPTFYCGPAGVYANRERPPRPVGRGGSRAATDAKPGANRRAGPACGLRSYEHSWCYRARAGIVDTLMRRRCAV